MRITGLGLIVAGLSACATPQHRVADAGDPLAEPRGAETLDQIVLRESQGDGCLVAGNANQNRSDGFLAFPNRCAALRDLIAPPELPAAPPPPPTMPTNG